METLTMVLSPIETAHEKAIYNSYVDDTKNAWEQKAVEEATKKIPLTVQAAGLVKAGTTTVGKAVPLITPAFVASDVVDGWQGADKVFQNPGLAEKLASGAASAANGFSLGYVPKQEAAEGLAAIMTGRRYMGLPDVSAEDIAKWSNLEQLKKDR